MTHEATSYACSCRKKIEFRRLQSSSKLLNNILERKFLYKSILLEGKSLTCVMCAEMRLNDDARFI